MIEEIYAKRLESVGPTVDLFGYPGPFTEPPPPQNDLGEKGHEDPSSHARRAEPSNERILEAVNASEVRRALRAKTGSASGPDLSTVLNPKRKVEEGPGVIEYTQCG